MLKLFMKPGFHIACVVLLISCQTFDIAKTKGACESLDWFEIGRSHGVQGLNSLKWKQEENKCENFSNSNHESYVNGWYAGIDEFCSDSHGFAYGKSGQEYTNVCPSGKENAFIKSYKQGTKIFRYETENKSISEELQALNRQQKEDPKDQPATEKRIKELNSQLKSNRAQIFEINRKMEKNSSQSTSI